MQPHPAQNQYPRPNNEATYANYGGYCNEPLNDIIKNQDQEDQDAAYAYYKIDDQAYEQAYHYIYS